MTSVRDRINDLAEKNLTYADKKWDKALLGFVERYDGTVLPCYGYQALKVLASTRLASDGAYKAVMSVIGDGHFVMHKLGKTELWDVIRENRLPRWEMLDRAILGVGQLGWSDQSVVYNRALCTQVLSEIQSVSSDKKMAASSQAILFFDTCIAPVQLGPNSPWYLTVIQ